MKQLDLFKLVEPESDLEKLENMVSYKVTSVSEPTEERLPYRTYTDNQDQLDIIDFDIDSAIESGDKERLSQLVELRKSYMN